MRASVVPTARSGRTATGKATARISRLETSFTLDRSLVRRKRLARHFLCVLVVAQADEARMPQMIGIRPFRELDLRNELRLQPAAPFHHLGGECHAASRIFRF